MPANKYWNHDALWIFNVMAGGRASDRSIKSKIIYLLFYLSMIVLLKSMIFFFFFGRWFFFSSNVILSNQLINGIYTCLTPLGVCKCAILNICAYHCVLWLNKVVRIENSNWKLKHPAETCRKHLRTKVHTSRRSPNKSNDFTLSCILNWASELCKMGLQLAFAVAKLKKYLFWWGKKLLHALKDPWLHQIGWVGVCLFFYRVHLNNTL